MGRLGSLVVLMTFFACQEPKARPVVSAPVQSTAAPSSSSTPPPSEEGTLLESAPSVSVARGDVAILDEHRAVFRDAGERLRTFSITPRELQADERSNTTLALGDRVTFGLWDVRWIAVAEGLIRLEGRHRGKVVGQWSSAEDPRAATHAIETSDHLFSLEARIAAVHGRPNRADGRVEVAFRAIEHALPAKLGQALTPGVYVFPGGLRVHLAQTTGCDYDPTAPCPFGGNYHLDAALSQDEVHIALKSAQTKMLGHVIELGRGTFIVRKQ